MPRGEKERKREREREMGEIIVTILSKSIRLDVYVCCLVYTYVQFAFKSKD